MATNGLKESNDGLSKVWKVESSSEPLTTGGKVELVEVSLDEGYERQVIVCLYDDNVKIADWNTGEPVLTLLDDEDDVNDSISCFAMRPYSFEIVVSTASGQLQHYALMASRKKGTSKLVRSIKAHNMPILCMAYDPTGTLVATGSTDHTAKIWDIEKGYCTHSFREHEEAVSLVRFHPDQHRLQLTTASHDCSLRFFDLADSKCVASFKEHMSLPTAIDWASDKYLMASVGRDKVRKPHLVKLGRKHQVHH